VTVKLWHRTCGHRIEQILADGELRPQKHVMLGYKMIWLTPMPWADRDALGLSSNTLACDRMEYLLEVVDPHQVAPWSAVKQTMDRVAVRYLEATRGARPDYWWVTGVPQQIRLVDEPRRTLRERHP